MSMLGGTMANSRGDVYALEYSDSLLNNVEEENPVALGVVGHIVKMGLGKEGDVNSIHERERTSSHRLTMRVRYDVVDAIADGLIYKETHYKHPVTKAWMVRATPVKYKIDSVVSAFAANSEVIVSLSRYGG